MKSTIILLVSLFVAYVGALLEPEDIELNRRIIGGRPARKGEFPYQVALRQPGSNMFCGGSIIDKEWVLTAAHCFWGKKDGLIRYAITADDVEVIPGGVMPGGQTDLTSIDAIGHRPSRLQLL